MNCHIPFSGERRRGARRAEPLLISPPSPFHREERARCLESESAIDESIRMLTRSTMHPVRPGGTRTTDSSSPLAQPRPRSVGPSRVTPAFDHCGVSRAQPRTVPRALPRARFPIEGRPVRRLIHSTAGSPPHLSTIRDPRRERREPSPHPIPFWTEGVSVRHLS